MTPAERAKSWIELQVMFECMEAKGVLIKTGESRFGTISQTMQPAYRLAPGVTREQWKAAVREFVCDSAATLSPCPPAAHLFGEFRRRAGPGPGTPGRGRISPFSIDNRTLRAWARGLDLRAPRWKTPALFWPEQPRRWSVKPLAPADKARFTVSGASVVRAQARPARPRPLDVQWLGADHHCVVELIREIGKNWTAPATVEWASPELGEGYAENISHKYTRDRQAEKLRPLHFGRRIYTAEEIVTARIEAALLEEVALGLLGATFDDASADTQATASIWNAATTLRGTDDSPWHRATVTPTPTDTEITAALDTMLKTADRVTARGAWPVASEAGGVKLVAKGPTQSRIGRACAAALLVALAYPFRDGRSRWQRREVEAAAVIIGLRWHLLSVGPRSWGTDLASVLQWGGCSGRRIGQAFGYSRDTALRRARADEGKLDALFGRFLLPNQGVRQPRKSGCIMEVSTQNGNPPQPFQLDDAAARSRLAGEYRAKAAAALLDGFSARCRVEPMASLIIQAWLRGAYRVIATAIGAGARILICPAGLSGLTRFDAPWYVDERSDASVSESFTGSVFRKPGLSPDRTPAQADVAAVMLGRGTNAEGESDRDADHDTTTYFAVPKPVDLDDPGDDKAPDDPLDGLTIVNDDEDTGFAP
jgi:hypothetical protein